jgi:hypothetical protein
VIRFLDLRSKLIPRLQYFLPTYTGNVHIAQGTRKVTYGGYGGIGSLDMDIRDIYKNKVLNLNNLING